jgi:hypothetical protein
VASLVDEQGRLLRPVALGELFAGGHDPDPDPDPAPAA